jgi:hypothetical protein
LGVWSRAQAVQHLPSKNKDLSSNPSTKKKKNQRNKKNQLVLALPFQVFVFGVGRIQRSLFACDYPLVLEPSFEKKLNFFGNKSNSKVF